MPIIEFEGLNEGLNELANPQKIKGLQESVNYEMLGDGRLTRRRDPVEYGDHVSGDSLKTKLNEIFTQSILQISPPYNPVKRVVDDSGVRVMEGEFIILVYGLSEDGWALYMCYENTDDSWTTTRVDIENIKYDKFTYLEFFIGDDKIIITDTRELTSNLPHYVKVDAEGVLITGRFGVPAPTNRATVEATTVFDRNDYEDVGTRARLGDCGIFQCVYTIVTEEGEESNPSPISETRNMQFFEKDAVDFNDARWVSSVLVSNLSIPNVSDDLTKRMKYFNIYYRIIRYSEGTGAQPFLFSQRFEILDKDNYSGETGNQYSITVEADLANPDVNVSYENDISPIAKHAAEISSIVGLGNIREKISFPFEFHRYTSIEINNITNKNYVDAVVQITLYDKNQPVDGIDVKQEEIIDELDLTYYYSGSVGEIVNVNRIRLFGADLKTMLPVIYEPYSGGTSINLYVKLPLLIAGGVTHIYLCFNKNSDSPYGVDNDDYKTAEYGQWVLMGEDWDNQQLFQSERVKDNVSIICMPNEIEDNPEEVINRVNTLDNGEFKEGAKWINDRVGKTLLIEDGEIGANKAIQLPTTKSYVKFDNLNLSGITKGYYYGRIKYDAEAIGEDAFKILAILKCTEVVVENPSVSNLVNYIGIGIDFRNIIPFFPDILVEPKWVVYGGVRIDHDAETSKVATIEFPTVSEILPPLTHQGSGMAEYFVLLSFDKEEKISLFVADLATKRFIYEEVLWSSWENLTEGEDELNLNETIDFQFGCTPEEFAISESIYDQWQYVNGIYLSATSLDDKTAVYNIANYMPSFDKAIGIKLL